MKKNIKVFLIAIIMILLISIFFVKKITFKENKDNDLINISNLPEEFMNDYFEETSKIKEEDKENILIVISKNKIKNTYGASNVIEAPNNQYILQYESSEDKNVALINFESDKSITSVNENIVYTIDATDYNSWGIEKIGLDYAMEIAAEKDLNDVVVAVIDTGFIMDIIDDSIKEKIIDVYNVLDPDAEMTDEYGHGSHVAGTIIEGTPSNVKVLPIKVSTDGNIYDTDIIEAINYVVYYDKADVINMSFGSYKYSNAIYQAIAAANEKNIISIASAGNDTTASNHYPSAFDNTISISAVNESLNIASFSNYGSSITFAAPGVDIESIGGVKSGTSMATPHAASAVAVLKSYNKNLTLDNTIELLKTHAVDLGVSGWDRYYGYGLISFEGAQFCNGTECDEYGVFMADSQIAITKIEIPYVLLTSYNYGTKYNLFNTNVKLYYTDDLYVSKKLWELDSTGLEINNYDPYKEEEQEIEIKYAGFTLSVTVPYPPDYASGWEYTILDENSIELTLYNDNINDIGILYIPEKIDGYNVVSLAGNSNLNSKVFGNSKDYYGFEEIILPKTLTSLGRASLMGGSFEKITSLAESISVGECAFCNVKSLKSFDGVVSHLGGSAFSGATLLESIVLSDDITEIPDSAFNQCDNLEKINIPSKVVSIGAHAFEGIHRLSDITLPEGLKTIGRNAFTHTNIANISLPNSLEEVGREAFYGSNIRNLFISESLTSIGDAAFSKCSSLESIVVDENNPIYDSRENSNALIETATNTLLKGIYSTTIPDTVTSISSSAFSYDLRLEEIEIPESVTEIGNYAFYECNYLKTIRIPRSVLTIGENALKNYPAQRQDMNYIQIPLTVLTYTDAYAKTYAVENKIGYDTMDPSLVSIEVSDKNFKAFDKVNLTDDILSIKLYYDIGKLSGTSYVEKPKFREESITDGYTIKYMNNNDSFRYGDTYYIVSGTNEYGESFEKQIDVTITKATPGYTIPTDLQANLGQKLSEIALPSGFEWVNPNQTIEETGNISFKANYTPADTTNYEKVENIDITISVVNPRTEIIPNIVLNNKIYDGTTTIEESNITISNLNTSEYTIVSAISSGADVGDRTATIKLKLTDEKFENYSFDNGRQEKEFIVNFEIVPEKLTKPTLSDYVYIYNGEEQIVVLNNYIEDKMNITGNKRTNAGEQDVIISLENSNYIWDDNTIDDVILKFKIEKANSLITYNSSSNKVKYDGNAHGINLTVTSPSNAKVKYMDEDGNYTLDDMPLYTEIGEYTIKYRIYIDDNHTDIYDEYKLTIVSKDTILFPTTGIKLDKEKITLILNGTEKLIVNLLPDYTDETATYTWTSSDENIVSVDSEGNITAKGIGKATITVTSSNGFTTSCEVTVSEFLKGDMNKDGSITITDVIKLLRVYLTLEPEESDTLAIGDMNEDGSITITDVIKLLRIYLNLE